LRVQRDGRSVTVEVTADGEGLVSHAGSALLAQIADKSGLTAALSVRLAGLKRRRSGHDPGRVVRDLAVMLGDGGDCLTDLGGVRDQDALFGAVASDSTAFRVIDRIACTPGLLDALADAHARAREHVWKQTGAPERVTIDVDATLLTSHFREGGRGRNVQGRLRLSSDAGLLRRDQRGAGRDPAPRQRRIEHRRRSDRGRRARARADPRRAHRRHRDPRARRHCWGDARPAGLLARAPAALLGRLRADRSGPRRDPPTARGCVGLRACRRRQPA
jgi:hypothetical protein